MLIGRARELATLVDAIDRAAQRSGGVQVVVGDAGMGKSALIAGAMEAARDRGFTVLQARCSDDPAAPPLWPWTVLLRTWAGAQDVDTVRRRLERVHPLLRRLAPDVAEASGLAVPPGPADDIEGRFVAGDALGRLVAGGPAPLMVVVEDLHHADAGTRAMVEPIATAVAAEGAVLLASTRSRAPATGLLAVPGAARIDLAPLADAEALALVAAVAGPLPRATAEHIVARAGGSPFFLRELALAERGAHPRGRTPPSVQDVARRHAEALGPDASAVLTVAAVLGPAPSLELLARVVGGPEPADRVVDQALDAGLLVAGATGLTWSHDLVREALVDAAGASAIRSIHGSIAGALADDPGADPLALAHHLLAARQPSPEAADAGERAARIAADAGAHEDVLRWIERTRPVAERTSDWPERQARLDELAGRSLVTLGDHVQGRSHLVAAAEHHLTTGDAAAAAEALLVVGAGRLRSSPEWEPPQDLLHRTLAAVGSRADLRCRLIGRQADLAMTRRAAEPFESEAIVTARASGDVDLLLSALGRPLATWRPQPTSEQDAALREITELARRATPERQFDALAFQALVLLERGKLDELERLLPAIEAQRLRLGLTRALGFDATAALVDLLRGRFDEAEERMDEALAAATGAHQAQLFAVRSLQIGLIGYLRGDLGPTLAESERLVALAAGTPTAVHVHCVRALVTAAAGHADLARDSIDEVFRSGLADLFDQQFGIGASLGAFLGEALWIVGDAARAAELEHHLAPWEGRAVVGGMAPIIAFGVADHTLALLAHSRNDLELARTRMDDALSAHRAMGSPPLVARSAVVAAELAREAGDADGAHAAAREAGRIAARHGLRLIGERAARVLAVLGAAPVRGAHVGGAPVALVFTDIESSTATAAALGDAAWLERLRAHNSVVRQLTAARGGREVKHLGDGFLLTFPSAASAVHFARDLQAALADGPVRVRVGVHSGPVLEDDGDVFGASVNLAARVASAASGGEILVTDAVCQAVPGLVTSNPRAAELKGVPGIVRLHRILGPP